MKHRYGFTVIELLAVIAIIGILITITGFGYSNYTKRARTDHTKRLVEEIIHKMEVYKSTNSAYPGELGPENSPSSLISSLSAEAKEQVLLGVSQPPSGENPESIRLLFCYRPDEVDIPVGSKINYWDSSQNTVQVADFGNSTEPGVVCN